METSRGVFWGQWINISALSTLKTLKVAHSCQLDEDLLQGLCEELELFPRTNALKILDITITVYAADRLVSVQKRMGMVVLSRGFSRGFDQRYPPLSCAKSTAQGRGGMQGIGGGSSKALSQIMGEHGCQVEFFDEKL